MKKLSIHISVLLLSLLLYACGSGSVSTTTEQPPEPISGHAQEITRAQTAKLTRLWNISAQVYGNPLNAQAALQKQADAADAHYYYVVSVDETTVPGQWHAQAILYR